MRQILSDKKFKWRLTAFLVNLLIAAAVFLPNIIAGGGLLTMGDDFDAQELAFNMLANREIKAGNVFFNWSIDIGSDFVTSLGFYNLGSPFFWLTFPFAPEVFPWLIGWVYILKYAVCGLFAMLWLSENCEDERYALLGSVLYAFSGFQATNLVFYHFHDAVALFPLLLLGLDACVKNRKKPGFFALMVGINALVNWNFFVAEVIFLVLYYFVRYTPVKRLRSEGAASVGVEIGLLFLMGILGAGIAAVILVPTFQSMLGFSRISDKLPLKEAFVFTREELLRNLRGLILPADAMNGQSLFTERNWYSVSAYLPLVGAAPAIAMIISYFGKKNWLSRMLVICAVMACIPILNNTFVLFNREPYRRWYYMPVLMMALAAAKMFELIAEGEERVKKSMLISLGITTGAAAFLWVRFKVLWKLEAFRWEGAPEHVLYNPGRWKVVLVVGIAGSLLTAAVLILLKKDKQMYTVLFALTALFSFLTTQQTLLEYKKKAYYTPQEVYNEIVRTGEGLESDVLPYRYSMVDDYYNRDMAHSLTSIDSFISTVDEGIFEFYDAVGAPRHVLTMDGPKGTEELLSVRYYLSKDPTQAVLEGKEAILEKDIRTGEGYAEINGAPEVADDDEAINWDRTGIFVVYDDKNALPMGLVYDSYITKSEFYSIEPAKRAIVMLHTLVVADEDTSFVGGILPHLDEYAQIDFGSALMDEDVARHKASGVTEFIHSTKGFSGKVETSGDRYVFFSVPYSGRWSALVNGERTKILDINGLIAVPVGAGESSIEFVYETRWHVAAFFISIISLSVVIVMEVLSNKRRNA